MSNIKKKKKKAKGGEGEGGGDNGSVEESRAEERVMEGGREGGRGGGLRGFVRSMEGQSHRMVEMRLAVVAACSVAFRVLLYHDLEGGREGVAWAALSLVAVSVLVVILSTWLDYFPSRLTHLQLRQVDGQGVALGCLLVPTVLCSTIHCCLYASPEHVELLSWYLLAVCALSLLSLSTTIIYSIPYPNNITLYNFIAMGTTFALYYWLNAPYWLLVPCVVVYSCVVPYLLTSFPGSFSLCEAMMAGQGLALLVTDTSLQILARNELLDLPEMFKVSRHRSLLHVEFLVFGVLLCCLLISPALYKIDQARNYLDHKFWSGTFILLSLGVGVVAVLPWLQAELGGYHPIALVLMESSRPVHGVLLVFWVMVTVAAVALVKAQNSETPWLAPLGANQPSSLWLRKCFHLLSVLVFLPGLVLSSEYLSLASSIALFFFSALELMRYFRMWPGGEGLHTSLQSLTDCRDSGPLLLSHLYLLLGLSLPLWLSPLRDGHHIGKLALYSGVLSVGVGDSMAALAGTLIGKTFWPGTKKTLEGSGMSILTQLLVVMVIVVLDPHVSMPTMREWGVVSGTVVATAIMEAYTAQIDNLVIPLFQLAFFLTFL